jgi:Asp-tRNA(Asn)/Glu-tRNA(Gln) amidotransferase C subunit
MDPISIATAAFTAIKSSVEVGKQLTDVSGQIIKFVNQMTNVEEEHKKQKASWFTSSNEEALDTFFKIQKVHQMEEQLREVFMLYGNINMWNEFVAIRAKVRKDRQIAKAKKRRERAELIQFLSYGGLALGVIAIFSIIVVNYFMLTK